MTDNTAFVGDIHGNLSALRGLLTALDENNVRKTIFLGDYINKGSQSAEVMAELIYYSKACGATLLRGNHEIALLDALKTGDLTDFLKMGGAMTIRSYVGTKVGPDVLKDFRDKFPIEHWNALQCMLDTYETDDLIAQHVRTSAATQKFHVSAHSLVGELPRIGYKSAQLDTGCGAITGRLTALLWPSLDYIQVDSFGTVVTR